MWNELSMLKGRDLQTLGRARRFSIVDITCAAVLVRPGCSGSERIIPRAQIDAAYRQLVQHGNIDLAGIRHHSEMNPVYVAAMLAELPGITSRSRPKIVLTCTNRVDIAPTFPVRR